MWILVVDSFHFPIGHEKNLEVHLPQGGPISRNQSDKKSNIETFGIRVMNTQLVFIYIYGKLFQINFITGVNSPTYEEISKQQCVINILYN